ncbi:unnamed protein product [Penicillium camemberti]|uniref:Str. FM013 n=1 Tax=Penicillium camemberti (strain FM 013) TaxID=1429867 RepID=A0A0G4P270_PENC3|nr:unnamed protein product [Penicillium camemberti]
MEFEEVHIKVKVKAKNEFKSKFDFESEFTMHIIPGIPPQKTHPLTLALPNMSISMENLDQGLFPQFPNPSNPVSQIDR